MNILNSEANLLYLFAKNRFDKKIKKEQISHPIFFSIKKEADKRYIDLMKKNYPDKPVNSVFEFKQVTYIDRILFKIHKSNLHFHSLISQLKNKADIYALNINIYLNDYLNYKYVNYRKIKSSSFINFFKGGLKSLFLINPKETIVNNDILYPIKPLLYSTLISNIFKATIKFTQLNKLNFADKFMFVGSFIFIIDSIRRMLKNKENTINNERINDIILNSSKYKKLFNIYGKQEDEMCLNYLKLNPTMFSLTKYKRLKFFPSLLLILSLLYKRSLFQYDSILHLSFTYLFSNELLWYYQKVKEIEYSNNPYISKIIFFKNNLINAYSKI